MIKKNVLIAVDLQNDFVDGVLGSKEAQAIIQNAAIKIMKATDDKDTLVIATKDTHTSDYMNTEEGKNLPVPHCIKDTDGWQLNPQIEDALDDSSYTTLKNTFGAVDGLNTLLTSIQKYFEIERIELIGLCTDICVLSNAVIAKSLVPNAHVVVDAACCAGVTPESHDTALNAMKAIQIEVVNQGQEPWRK